MNLIVFLALLATLAILCVQQISLYYTNQNNHISVRNRNLAIIYGILCIILVLSAILNTDEFSNSNHKTNVNGRETQMQDELFYTTQVYGPLDIGEFYYKHT